MTVRHPARRGSLSLKGGTLTGDLNLGDDVKINLGDSQDLEIYHTVGGNSVFNHVPATGEIAFQSAGVGKLELSFDESILKLRDGYKLRISDAGDSDWADQYHDGTDYFMNFTNTNWLRFDNLSSGALFLDGAAVRIYDAANTDYVNMSHNGTDFSFAFTNTSNVLFSGSTYVSVRDGGLFIVGSSDNSENIHLEHDGTVALIVPTGISAGEPEMCLRNASGQAAPGNFYTYGSQSCADDATITFAMPRGVGMIFLHNNFSANTQMILAYGGGTTLVQISPDNANVDVGLAGTNPDTDGDLNVWMSASSVLSIKNRLGSSRSFCVTVIVG